ncbi:8-oxo-dGTP pyrophosphatase MutT (NUDIX family) [Arthrobacter sp. CAN_A212]|uniref:NUDIX hydrolase n=1 Tax=unclassified Arthrobacter TaxID=235627 RepID=UPI0018CADD96|nr:NUDIX domain-containing protein [Arthrobacter sp. CAN_C5]MBP2214945.1 8-oxo-dGTP pyrophosphatase MutT (NUDIX family) [Arthrobacter sp. CAN_C5]
MSSPYRGTFAVPRLAVSVLMVRGKEIFIQNRSHTMDFAAGAVVFPGGRVDDVDRVTAQARPAPSSLLSAHARCWAETSIAADGSGDPAAGAGVLLAAAVREVWEETGAVLSPQDLTPWANWITPASYGKRFDTYFYLAVLAPSLVPQHQTTEADSSHWSSVESILVGAAAGTLELMRPTEALLQELADLPGSLSQALGPILRAPRRITPVGTL